MKKILTLFLLLTILSLALGCTQQQDIIQEPTKPTEDNIEDIGIEDIEIDLDEELAELDSLEEDLDNLI